MVVTLFRLFNKKQACHIPAWSLLIVCAGMMFAAVSTAEADEHIFVSGGPSLRTFERHKPHPHDQFWGNFITSGVARHREIRNEIGSSPLTWLVFRPAYERRSKESGQDLIKEVQNMVALTGAVLIWFNDRQELIDYINKGRDRQRLKIRRLEYFGHSNKRNWCFDYSNQLDGAVQEDMCLHVDHLKAIDRRAFEPGAYTKSWGCHSGEEYSQAWRAATGVAMWGAVGKTNYSNGAVPRLSSQGGKWAQ